MTTLTDTQVITASGGLVELGYLAYNSGNVAVTAGTNSYIGGTLTCVCDGSPVLVETYVPRVDMAATADQWIQVEIDGVSQGRVVAGYNPGTQQTAGPTHGRLRVTPSAGSHTFRMRAYSNNATTTYLSGGGVFPDAFLRVSKIVQATQWPAVTTGTIICTSSTRPASPFEGQTIYETDTDSTYTYSGSAWTLTGTLGSGFVTASSTTAQGPSGSLTYIHATITVTPGVWIVNSAMSVFNATTSDGTSVGIYNRTTSAIVSGSMGVPRETSTSSSGYAALHSAPTKIVVSSNTDLCPYATRNGASNLQTTNWTGLHSQGVPTGLITAQRLYGG